MDEEQLLGGVANAGSVVRVGQHVLRPSNPHSGSIHMFLSALHSAGFRGASVPVGIDQEWNEMGGEERFDRRRRWWADHERRFADALR